MENWEHTLIDALTPEAKKEAVVIGEVVATSPLGVKVGELTYTGSRLYTSEHLVTRERKIHLDNVADEYESNNKTMTIYDPFNAGDKLICVYFDNYQKLAVLGRVVTRVVSE